MKTIYFDNAATSNYKPLSVRVALIKSLLYSANPGRSGHHLSIKNAVTVWHAREEVARHLNLEKPENVIFTKNCTEALNIAILGTDYSKKNHVVCTTFEHNSVLRPLMKLKTDGKITLSIVEPLGRTVTASDVRKVITPLTKLVCLTAYSNVTGNRNDVENIAKLCHDKGILLLLDFAQGIGHEKIDMTKLNISYLAFSGHKGLLTPQGIGVLAINTSEKPSPILMGGTGTESQNPMQPINLPESLESGTLSTPLIATLPPAIKYFDRHFAKNNLKTQKLTHYLYEKLSLLPFVKIYSTPKNNSGVISFAVKTADSNAVCDKLDGEYKICARGGLHCAPKTHEFLSTTERGLVRVSISFKNNNRQIDRLISALKTLYGK